MKKIEKFFLDNVPMKSMLWTRRLLGGTVFFYYLSQICVVNAAFGPHGILAAQAPTFREHLQNLQWLRYIQSEFVIGFLYFLLLISSVAFAWGYKPKITGAITLLLHSLFHARNEYMFWGWSELIKPFILYVVLSHSDKPKGPAWPLRLLQIHVCLMYFITATARLGDPAWLDGSVMNEILMSSLFSRIYPFPQILMEPAKLLAVASWILELGAPILLWSKKFGRYVALALICMHIGLELFTLLGWWNVVMVAGLLGFWLQPQRS